MGKVAVYRHDPQSFSSASLILVRAAYRLPALPLSRVPLQRQHLPFCRIAVRDPVDRQPAIGNSAYWQILKHLSEGTPEAMLFALLRMVADELHIAFDRGTLTAILPESKNYVPLYFGKLLYLYTEVRLFGNIRREVQRFLDAPPANKEKRTEILIYIAGRRELLRHVPEGMERPGDTCIIHL